MSDTKNNELPYKKTVLDYEDVCNMAPYFKGKPKLVNRLFKFLAIDKVNGLHERHAHKPGVGFVTGFLEERNATVKIAGEHVLDNLPEGSFITVSNHPLGAVDGIMLIKIVGDRRPDFKVMVNMILNHIGAMRENFIAVDALASNDPKKKAVSMKGIAEALRQVKEGKPIGFFPAGAVSKLNWKFRIEDRQWQPTIMRLIQKMNVPVIPIYFHDHNSWWFNLLGVIDWRLRTLRLPAEVFRLKNPVYRISVGEPIPVDTIKQYDTPEALGDFLKQQTYSMRKWNKQQ